MANIDIRKLIREVLSRAENVPDEVKEKIASAFEKKAAEEREASPRIAVIGKSGVGKSSTLNALFGTDLKIGHNKATTKEAREIKVKTKNGQIIFLDMPGLGESIATEDAYRKLYAEILPTCDVIIWIIMAPSVGRAMKEDQEMLRDVVRPFVNRIVIGVNQIDAMPGHWNDKGNYPSTEQKTNIQERVDDVFEKLSIVVPELTMDKIIAYSAIKRYRLKQLFEALLIACPDKRAWVVESRREIKSYLELLDPEVRKKIEEVN